MSGRGADLHIVQLMPVTLTVSCISKIQIGFTFLVPAYPGSPRKRALNLCVCAFYFQMLLLSVKLYLPPQTINCSVDISKITLDSCPVLVT